LKEAYLKYLGLGLKLNLKSFEFTKSGNKEVLLINNKKVDSLNIISINKFEGYKIAIISPNLEKIEMNVVNGCQLLNFFGI
jgi:phosphopantetheinyl transferase